MLRRTQWMVRLVLILGVAIGSVASVSLRGETPAPEASKTELSPSDLWYQDLCAAYLKADWVKFDEQIKIKSKHYYKMDRANRPMALAMQVSAKESRPTWWKNCRSPSPCSFKVRVWQKSFMANFKPSTSLGYQAAAAYDPRTRKLIYLVSWRPAYVDSTDPFDNDKMEEAYGLRIHRAEEYGFTMGNMAELIAWHELGHHCISSTFTIDQIEILYNNHRELYGVLQEFYADMAALYHASSPGRRMTLLLRAQGLILREEDGYHNRAALAIGNLLLSEWMANPEKWPSVHFPGTIPTGKTFERSLLIYVYRHIAKTWTVEEDIQLRKLLKSWIARSGKKAFTSKGVFSLLNRQSFHALDLADIDKGYKTKREAWLKEKLKKIIADKRADDPKLYAAALKNRTNEKKPKYQRDYEKRLAEARKKRAEKAGVPSSSTYIGKWEFSTGGKAFGHLEKYRFSG